MALFNFCDGGKFEALVRTSRSQNLGQMIYFYDCGYCYQVTIGTGPTKEAINYAGTLPKTDESLQLLTRYSAHQMTY